MLYISLVIFFNLSVQDSCIDLINLPVRLTEDQRWSEQKADKDFIYWFSQYSNNEEFEQKINTKLGNHVQDKVYKERLKYNLCRFQKMKKN